MNADTPAPAEWYRILYYKPVTGHNIAYSLGFSKKRHQMTYTNGSYPHEGHNLVTILLIQEHIRHFIVLNSLLFFAKEFMWLSDIKRVYFSWIDPSACYLWCASSIPFEQHDTSAITSPTDTVLVNSFALFSHKWN